MILYTRENGQRGVEKCLNKPGSRWIIRLPVFMNLHGGKKSARDAFLFLQQYRGISFLNEFYDVEHTLSMNDAMDDLESVCRKNGGVLSWFCITDQYDLVIGPVANDDMALLFRQFEQGFITIKVLTQEMTFKQLTNQYSFHTERAIKYLQKVGAMKWVKPKCW